MITKEELIQLEEKFKEKIETSTDNEFVIKKFDSYYKYLQDRLDEPQDQEMFNLINVQVLKLIYRLIQWLDRRNIKSKDFSKDWNKKLVARVGNYCNELNERRKNGTLDEQTFKIKEHFIHQDLFKERDALTVSYCWSMLIRTLGPELIPTLIQAFENGNGELQEPNKHDTYVYRPGFDGKQIKDNGMKYWHLDAKELMTYDECTERCLGHHLLYYPVGHEWQNMSVGFMETDPSKVQKNFDKETEEFIETVFVDEATLTD